MHAEDFVRVDNYFGIITHTILVFSMCPDPDFKPTNIS